MDPILKGLYGPLYKKQQQQQQTVDVIPEQTFFGIITISSDDKL